MCGVLKEVWVWGDGDFDDYFSFDPSHISRLGCLIFYCRRYLLLDKDFTINPIPLLLILNVFRYCFDII